MPDRVPYLSGADGLYKNHPLDEFLDDLAQMQVELPISTLYGIVDSYAGHSPYKSEFLRTVGDRYLQHYRYWKAAYKTPALRQAVVPYSYEEVYVDDGEKVVERQVQIWVQLVPKSRFYMLDFDTLMGVKVDPAAKKIRAKARVAYRRLSAIREFLQRGKPFGGVVNDPDNSGVGLLVWPSLPLSRLEFDAFGKVDTRSEYNKLVLTGLMEDLVFFGAI